MAIFETAARIAEQLSASVVFVTLVLLFGLLLLLRTAKKGLPPGPYPWPLLGNLYQMSKDPREYWPLLRAKYGDVFSLYMGNRLAVVLASPDAIREAFVKFGDIFSDRPDLYVLRTLAEGKGVISSSGELWQEHRKFSANILRDLGVTKSTMEDVINVEVNVVTDAIGTSKGEPIEMHILFQAAIANIICSAMFGERFAYDDRKFINHINSLEEGSEALGSTGLLNVFPWIRHIPGLVNMKKINETKTKTDSFIWDLAEKVKTDYDNGPPTNLTQAYLQRIREDALNTDSTFTEDQMIRVLGDFFFAGTETTAGTLEFMVAYLVLYPKMQQRIQAEIDEVVGNCRSPSVRDRSAMPFTEAFISETQRFSSITPLGVAHGTSQNADFRGYFIPRGTLIFPFLHGALYDKETWGDPENFRPNRFLNNAGKHEKPDQFVPFSLGRRTCLGEPLARMELFLFLSGLLQNFTLRLPDGASEPNLKGTLAITVIPPRFQICADRRSPKETLIM